MTEGTQSTHALIEEPGLYPSCKCGWVADFERGWDASNYRIVTLKHITYANTALAAHLVKTKAQREEMIRNYQSMKPGPFKELARLMSPWLAENEAASRSAVAQFAEVIIGRLPEILTDLPEESLNLHDLIVAIQEEAQGK